MKTGINARVVRLPFSVHGPGDHGFVPMLIGIAREKGFAAYVAMVKPLAGGASSGCGKAYRLALETPETDGPFHAIGEEGIPFRAIAEAIGQGLNLPVRSLTPDDAGSYFGFLGIFAGMDGPASCDRTRAALGWQPAECGLLADIGRSGYF